MSTTRSSRRRKKVETAIQNELINYDVEEGETTCSECYAEFLDPEDLKTHLEQVHSSKTVLDQVQPSKINLQPVQPPIKGKGPYCKFCNKILPSLFDLAVHIRDQHLLDLKCCKYCLTTFVDSDKFIEHGKKHRSDVESKLSCANCQILFSKTSELKEHVAKKHSDESDGMVLNCYDHLSSLLNTNSVLFLSYLSTTTKFTCACKKHFSTLEQFVKHLKKKNCSCKHVCFKCFNCFSKKAGLVRHFGRAGKIECGDNDNVKIEAKKCSKCQKSIKIDEYKFHFKKCRKLICQICNITFDKIEELTSHQSEMHATSVTLRKCRYCRVEVVGPKSLKKHMEFCHGSDYKSYKYDCVYCEKFFNHPQKLFTHFTTVHKGIKPFTCNICKESFTVRKKFTFHIKLKHESKGFVEFNDDLTVAFNEKKSENAFQPADRESLFNEVEEQEFRQLGLFDNDKEQAADDTEVDDAADTNDKKVFKKPFKVVKRVTRKRKQQIEEASISSDDEPMQDKKRSRNTLLRIMEKKKANKIKLRFTCNVCKKYCYSFQNYNRHISSHFKGKRLRQCIKCAKLFPNVEELNKHMETEHATSKINDTLKEFLEKRQKLPQQIEKAKRKPVNMIKKTIQKVIIPPSYVYATVKKVYKENSAKNFLENFTPDDSKVDILTSVSIKVGQFNRKRTIKITKCNTKTEEIENTKVKLRMPEKFKKIYNEPPVEATIKFVNQHNPNKPTLNYGDTITKNEETYEDNYADNFQEYDDDHQNSTIPEVADEIILGNTEVEYKTPKPAKEKLPLPGGKQRIVYVDAIGPYGQMKIATLQPVEDGETFDKSEHMPTTYRHEKSQGNPENEDTVVEIILPEIGSKLVQANPFAHLLDDQSMAALKTKKRKYKYEPKIKDAQNLIARALLQLGQVDEAIPKKRKYKKNKFD